MTDNPTPKYCYCYQMLEFDIKSTSKEWDILQKKLNYLSNNPTFVDDIQDLRHHLNELKFHIEVVNRGLLPLPSEQCRIIDLDEEID